MYARSGPAVVVKLINTCHSDLYSICILKWSLVISCVRLLCALIYDVCASVSYFQCFSIVRPSFCIGDRWLLDVEGLETVLYMAWLIRINLVHCRQQVIYLSSLPVSPSDGAKMSVWTQSPTLFLLSYPLLLLLLLLASYLLLCLCALLCVSQGYDRALMAGIYLL